ncbi:MAG: aminoacyl-tRNA hydrolase [Bacillota bacterium]
MGLFDKWKKEDNSDVFVIVGLGNPDGKYKGTRHNIGFSAIDTLAEKFDIKVDQFKHKALFGKGVIAGRKVFLVKPQTYMNLSGESVKEVVNFYKVPQENFLVIYDDISLPVGALRIRKKGGHGGQNGMKNIIQLMGTDEFPRLKVGIGDKPNGWDLTDHVLGKFSEGELADVAIGLDNVIVAVEWILKEDVEKAMNEMNQRGIGS